MSPVTFASVLVLFAWFVASDRSSLSLGKTRHLLSECSTDGLSIEALKPTLTHSPVTDLQWLDKNDQKVVAMTKRVGWNNGGGFWLSNDSAKSWTEKTQALTDTMSGSSSASEPVEVLAVYTQKSNPANVVIIGAGSFIWKSSDFCQTVSGKPTPGGWKGSGIKSMRLHPWHDNWLLVLVKRPDCKNLDHALTQCPNDLFMTQDLFGTLSWINVTAESKGNVAGFVDFDWGANLCPDQTCSADMKVSRGLCQTMLVATDFFICGTSNGTSSLTCVL